jgi:predicted GH43/DUF377 family glycosyl hydrolase
MIKTKRSTTILKADPTRVILLFYSPGLGASTTIARVEKLIHRVLALSEDTVETLYKKMYSEFHHRHVHLKAALHHFYLRIHHLLPQGVEISEKRQHLLGAHFAKEYSIQAAALFNPSIVPHPNQESLARGEKRFIISLRSVGEGHISSIEFRSGIISSEGIVTLDEITPFSTRAEKDPLTRFEKDKIKERTAIVSNFDNAIFDPLPEHFSYQDYVLADEEGRFEDYDISAQKFLFEIMDTNYNVVADGMSPLCERVIFPSARGESRGMEDVRFVEFTHDSGKKEFIGTYTAYDGHKITPQMILTEDFVHFRIRTMFGRAVSDKGFALFPEKVNGKYLMAARQGGEDLTIMESDDLFNWDSYEIMVSPEHPWGLVQQGNCGSPLKTEKGWLLITHAVGPIRQYVISAILLDLDQPKNIIGQLKEPLISPNENEREGYVPNVVYSCGSIIHNGNLIIPYAMSDSATSFVTISLAAIFEKMGI